MSEQLTKVVERVVLSELQAGDVVKIVTGVDESAFTYTFTVQEPGNWPTGHLVETDSNDVVTASGSFTVQGSGLWTTRSQNPVQTQERAFTSSFDSLTLGMYMVGSAPDTPAERIVFDNPGQEISFVGVNTQLAL